jgi:hypothetical protein
MENRVITIKGDVQNRVRDQISEVFATKHIWEVFIPGEVVSPSQVPVWGPIGLELFMEIICQNTTA